MSMNSVLFPRAIVCVALLAGIGWYASPLAQAAPPQKQADAKPAKKAAKKAAIGRRIAGFVGADAAGKQRALADFRDSKLVVVVFIGTECPIGNAYMPALNQLQKQYPDVQVVGVNSNLSDNADSIRKHQKEFKLNFPVLVDAQQEIADLFSAQRTPEAFVLDARRTIRYRGRIDDRFGYIYKREKSRRQELDEAVQQLLAGKPVAVAKTEPVGCLITRRDRLQAQGKITYAKHASRILHKRCAECHHPGTAAPFSLLTYEDARNWSEMIKETVVQRRMPPWNADPRHGKFSNDLRLTRKEIDTLVGWIDGGAPLGNKQDLPPTPKFADGWTIGKPDVVFEMPRSYKVKATGTVRYQYFVTPTNFKEDVWVQAAEARPGNRAVVHHIIVFFRKAGTRRRGGLPAIVGTAPGEEPMIWPEGVGFKIPAGSELVWQVHYTPTGKEEIDRSQVGFVFSKTPPTRAAKSKMAINTGFKIPAGAADHKVESKARFWSDAELLSLMPHMHLRGKDFQYVAHFPDGRTEVLLNVPSYDFNWQHRYRFAKPLFVPRGTVIRCVAHFDNSADNPANPDPTKRVGWGDQTWEEMMIGFINYIDARPAPQSADSKPVGEEKTDKPRAKQGDPSSKEKTPDKAAESASEPQALVKGKVVKRTYHFREADKAMEYRLFVPTKYDASRPTPLIVALHGLRSNPQQILGYPGFTRHAEKHGYILVAPMGYNSRGWYGSLGKGGGRRSDPSNLGELSEKDVLNVLKRTRKELNVDPRRIYIFGHSMGGGGALHLAVKYPQIWAAIAPVAPAAYGSRKRLAAARKIPFLVVQGDKDRLVKVEATRRWIDQMKELEMTHRYIEVKGGGHVLVAFQHFPEIFEFFEKHPRPQAAE